MDQKNDWGSSFKMGVQSNSEKIRSRNPATDATLANLDQTPLEKIPTLVKQARVAQKLWAELSPKARADYFWNVREYLLDHLDEITDLITQENGKPSFEALVNDLFPSLDLLTQYAKKAPRLLQPQRIPLLLMKHRKSYLHFVPKGVVAIIAPWNYPFSIPFGQIVLALLAGNAVIFKPSEAVPLIGLKIAEIFERSFFPSHLLQVVIGDGSRGAALVKAPIDKIFFTGSVVTGKKIMAQAAERLTPVVLELGGKDPMIVFPDANLDFATSAALWGGFSNSGQACASVERILVHESIHDAFIQKLKEKTLKLKSCAENGVGDLGVVTFERQKEVYANQLSELNSKNSVVVTGGKFTVNKTTLEPTIITNPPGIQYPLEETKIYNEETFGPVVAVTKFSSTQEAIEKANKSNYGLLASIITDDIGAAQKIAKKIEAGSILINEVLYTHGLSETPWGGVKDSGFGRVHSDHGFFEFVDVRHIHAPRKWIKPFKSWWWFPYTKHQFQVFRTSTEVLFRRSLVRKISAMPKLIREFILMLKFEKRL